MNMMKPLHFLTTMACREQRPQKALGARPQKVRFIRNQRPRGVWLGQQRQAVHGRGPVATASAALRSFFW